MTKEKRPRMPRDDLPEFHISFGGGLTLTIEDIWPEESDRPENPTPKGVIEAMKSSAGPSKAGVLSEWSLTDDLVIHVWSRDAVEAEW